VDENPKTGSFAATCLTEELACYGLERGYLMKGKCPTGIQPVLKKVYAGVKDAVTIKNGRVAVNGHELDGFDILETDSQGRVIAVFYKDKVILKKDEFWLMSDHKKNSWDSRYWGPVTTEYTFIPVWTFNE
jgi:conjugative transfer signal peptidase TraF